MNLVSIITPTYNRPDYLDRLLKSIDTQTFRDFDIVVVDDNSNEPDAYEVVINRYRENGLEIRYVRNDINRGAQYSRNLGVSLTHSKYLAFVDDDDEWFPNKLEKQLDLLERCSEEVGLVYTWADAVECEGNVVHQYRSSHRGDDLRPLLQSCFIPSPTVMLTRAAYDAVGGFDETLRSCQDWDMWTRIVEAGYCYEVVEQCLAVYHKHDRPSIGRSTRRLEGYLKFYGQHSASYNNQGLRKVLSENYRALAAEYSAVGDRAQCLECLRLALSSWSFNYKAGIRLIQTIAGLY